MTLHMLNALSPLDGRYAEKVNALSAIFSESALIQFRIRIELLWFITLTRTLPDLKITEKEYAILNTLLIPSPADIMRVKTLEKKTQHDLKAVEYFLKEKFDQHPTLAPLKEFIHFGCTSEDINNLAYALMLTEGKQILLQRLEVLMTHLANASETYADTPMLARTHGQPATPTTLGKELANIYYRLQRQNLLLKAHVLLGKINGAVGNFNAHCIAYPDIDWLSVSRLFVTQLHLQWNPYTTQIEPHDAVAELCHLFLRINTIFIDCARDMWGYIALGYFRQRATSDTVGSSTMPHKINPIHFENAEGNLGLANALFQHFAEKLPISRFQRDLSDSTVLRNMGVAYAHTDLAYQSLLTGFQQLEVNSEILLQDLEQHPEVLTEALQTVMRRYGIEHPYEKLKTLARGTSLTQQELHRFIEQLSLPVAVKKTLLKLSPQSYMGLAAQLAKNVKNT